MTRKRYHRKKTRNPWKGFEPKQSCPYGYEDEGISSVLGKPRYFRYSEQFLRAWYTKGPDSEMMRRKGFR